jgi:hypothetical protein
MQHERCIIDLEEFIEYEGQSSILARLSDVLSSAQVTLILQVIRLSYLPVFKIVSLPCFPGCPISGMQQIILLLILTQSLRATTDLWPQWLT